MRIRFSARAWVLSAATGLVFLPATDASAGDDSVEHSIHVKKNERQSGPAGQLPLLQSIQRVSGEVAEPATPGMLNPEATDDARPARPLFPALFPGRTRPVGATIERPTQARTELTQPPQLVSPGGTPIGTAPVSAGGSEVQQHLEELYRRNGRPVPEGMIEDMTAAEIQANAAASRAAVSQAPARQVATSPVKRFFQKITPFRRSNPNDERPEHVEPLPAQARADLNRIQQGQASPEKQHQIFTAPRGAAASRPAASASGLAGLIPPAPAPLPSPVQPADEDDTDLPSPASVITEAASLPEFQPAVRVPRLAEKLPSESTRNSASPDSSNEPPRLSDSNLTDAPVGFDTETAVPKADDILANPFPELSEAEADQSRKAPAAAKSPFSGLSLDSPPTVPSIPEIPEIEAETELPSKSKPEFEPLTVPATAGAAPGLPLLPTPNSETPAVLKTAGSAEPARLPQITPTEKHSDTSSEDTRMRRIAERTELKGLKGFCPVALRDERQLKDALPRFKAEFKGRTYNLSSEAALATFQAAPDVYAPANSGQDVVRKHDHDVNVEGMLDFAVWFKDKLYLFETRDSLDKFSVSPASYVDEG